MGAEIIAAKFRQMDRMIPIYDPLIQRGYNKYRYRTHDHFIETQIQSLDLTELAYQP